MSHLVSWCTLKAFLILGLIISASSKFGPPLLADTFNQTSKLIVSVHAQDFLSMQDALKAGEDANLKDGKGNSALHIACSNHCFHGGLLLLDHGADPKQRNAMGSTPIDILIGAKLVPKSAKPEELKHWLDVRVTDDIRNLIAKCRATINEAARIQIQEAQNAGYFRPRDDDYVDPRQDITIPARLRIITTNQNYRPYFQKIPVVNQPPEAARQREAAIRLGNDAIWLSECAFGANSQRSGWAKRRVWEVCGRNDLIANEKLDQLTWDTNAPQDYRDDPNRSQFDQSVWRYLFLDSREALFQSFDEINRIDTWISPASRRKVTFLSASIDFHINVAEFLLRHGADPNLQFDESTWTALYTVIFKEIALNDTLPNSAALIKVHQEWPKRQDDLVNLLLDYHADPNIYCGGLTPLMLAGLLGRDNVIPLLLKAGADPTLVSKNLRPNFDGKTAYEMAVIKGHTKAADCLRSD